MSKRVPCWFVVIHCPSAEDAAAVSARMVEPRKGTGADAPRIMRGGEKLGKRGECY